MMISSYRGSIGRKGGGKARIKPTASLDFTQSHEPIRALPYGTGELYKFSRESSRWLQVYDTDSGSLVWREIGANVVPITGFYYADLNANGSPYDANGNLIPSALRQGYHRGPGATNTIENSRDFSSASWGTTGTISISRNIVGFDGVSNAGTTLTDTDTGSVSSVFSNLFAIADDNATHTSIVWVEKNASPSVYPEIKTAISGGTTTLNYRVRIDPSNGDTFFPVGSFDVKVFEEDGYYILVLFTPNNSSGNTTLRLFVFPAASATLGGAFDNSLTGSTGIDQAEVRLNTSFYDRIPIVTTGSAVTTLGDDYNLAIANHNQDQGMILLEAIPGLDSSALVGTGNNNLVSTFMSRSDGQLYYSSLSFNTIDDANNVAVVNHGGFSAGDTIKPSVRWGNGTMTLVLNGSTDSDVYSGSYRVNGDHLSLFRAGIFPWYLKSLRYYQRDRGTAWISKQQS